MQVLYEDTILDPNCKEALKVAKAMYDEGLIDPEFVVKDVANMEPDIANGKIGMMFHAGWGTWHPFNLTYLDSGVITRPYPAPTAEGYNHVLGINSNQTGEFFVVSSKCEHPEAIIKILNLYEAVAMSGSDEEFETYWADEQYRFCPIYIGVPTELFVGQVGAAKECLRHIFQIVPKGHHHHSPFTFHPKKSPLTYETEEPHAIWRYYFQAMEHAGRMGAGCH